MAEVTEDLPPAVSRWVTGARFLLRKVGLLTGAVVVTSLLLFITIKLIPGDPVALRMKNPDPVRVAAIRAELGLDRPMAAQYLHYVWNFATGHWGRSLLTGRPVVEEWWWTFAATMELALGALAIGTVLGVALGLASPWLGWAWLRRLAGGVGAIGLTVPIFWLGLMLIIVFSYKLELFPVGGRFDYALSTPRTTGFLVLDCVVAGRLDLLFVALRHLALPVCTLSLYPAAMVCAILQARLDEPRLTALVRALRSRGYSPARIWLRHVLRLLGAPLVTVLGTNFGGLLGGAVLTETVFSWPGMGRWLVQGVLNRDVPVVEHALLAVILLSLLATFLADMIALLLNPQAAFAGEQEGA